MMHLNEVGVRAVTKARRNAAEIEHGQVGHHDDKRTQDA